MSTTVNAALYNASTFNLEDEITLQAVGYIDIASEDWENTYQSKLVPTMLNGYCKLYEFYRDYPVNTFVGKLDSLIYVCTTGAAYCCFPYFSVLYACKQIV